MMAYPAIQTASPGELVGPRRKRLLLAGVQNASRSARESRITAQTVAAHMPIASQFIPSTYHITNHTQGERRDGRSGLGRVGLCKYVD